MLTLFIRSIFMYLFVFFILRLTGKRQVSDLQPFDLLITLLIADLAGSSIADTGTPLLYSVVPILGMYLIQQLVTFVCLKSARTRQLICGSPVILVRAGKVIESAMRETNYTLIDLLDQLRSKDVFDLDEVAYAILETNGSMSVLLKSAFQPPGRGDLNLPERTAELSYMLVLDGQYCRHSLERLQMDQKQVQQAIRRFGDYQARDVFFLHRSPEGALTMQLKERSGGQTFQWKEDAHV